MLTIENLTKTYSGGKLKAVDDVSISVQSGEIYGFLGPNGAGKTTTIKLITGILRRDSGRIIIDGIDTAKDPMAAKSVTAYVPDNPDVQKKLKGIEYVNFMADMYGVPNADRKAKAQELASLFEIRDALNDRIESYSHGMQQKIVLIGALITDPRLLILDEPMVGLDPKSSFNLKELMRQMCALGKTIFFSTHVLDVAERFCDRVGIISRGRIVAQGTMDELRSLEGSQGSLEEIFLELMPESLAAFGLPPTM
jgi:ABC-2 type transport system ATP-binding protein